MGGHCYTNGSIFGKKSFKGWNVLLFLLMLNFFYFLLQANVSKVSLENSVKKCVLKQRLKIITFSNSYTILKSRKLRVRSENPRPSLILSSTACPKFGFWGTGGIGGGASHQQAGPSTSGFLKSSGNTSSDSDSHRRFWHTLKISIPLSLYPQEGIWFVFNFQNSF